MVKHSHIVWNPKVYYHVINSSTQDPSSQKSSPCVSTCLPCYLNMSYYCPFIYAHVSIVVSSLHIFRPILFFIPICTVCSILSLFVVITLIVFCKEYKFWSFSLCSFLEPNVTSWLFSKSIFLSNLCLTAPVCVLVRWETGFHTRTNRR